MVKSRRRRPGRARPVQAEVLPAPPRQDLTTEDLRTLTEILTRAAPRATPQQAEEAVRRTLSQYETQLRVFMVGLAKSKLNRLLRLLEILDGIEGQILDPARLQRADTKELTRAWSIAQTAAAQDLDLLQRVIDMRRNLEPTEATNIIAILGQPTDEQVTALAELALTPPERSRLRGILAGLIEAVHDGK